VILDKELGAGPAIYPRHLHQGLSLPSWIKEVLPLLGSNGLFGGGGCCKVLPPHTIGCHAPVHIAVYRPILVYVGMAEHHLIIPAAVWVFGAIANWAGPIPPRVNILCHYQLLIPEAGPSSPVTHHEFLDHGHIGSSTLPMILL
jgi:hypothetical protein